MELKNFIKSTLTEIIEGVTDARKIGQDASGIGSNMRVKIEQPGPGLMQDFNGQLYSIVEFDVAVTASTKLDGSAGVDVIGIKVGGSAGKEKETVSRVKFSIPMRFNVF